MADEEEVAEEETVSNAPEGSETMLTPVVETALAPPKYEVRPGLGEKFQSENVREIIVQTMQAQLTGRQYRADQAAHWTRVIANAVRQKAQELDMKRYKIIANTILLEMKGSGVKCAQRCIWDPETDAYIDDIYKNDSIFCYTIVYGVYMY